MGLPAVKDNNQLTNSNPIGSKRTPNLPAKGGNYQVKKGQDTPDSWEVQKEAGGFKLSSEIIDKIQTRDYAEVTVRVWHPEGWYVDSCVHHDFSVAQEMMYLDILKDFKQRKDYLNDPTVPFIKDETGNAIPNFSEKGFYKMAKRMIKFKNFSIRDATTKAMRIAQYKVLNKEFREKEEIEFENIERGAVQDEVNNSQGKSTHPQEQSNSLKQDDGSEIMPPKKDKKVPPALRPLLEGEINHLKKQNPNLKKAITLLEEDNADVCQKSILMKLENMLGDTALADYDIEAHREAKKALHAK